MILRDFKVGDTVILSGALASNKSMFIGEIDKDGYRWLWKDKEAHGSGEQYLVRASGSHDAQKG